MGRIVCRVCMLRTILLISNNSASRNGSRKYSQASASDVELAWPKGVSKVPGWSDQKDPGRVARLHPTRKTLSHTWVNHPGAASLVFCRRYVTATQRLLMQLSPRISWYCGKLCLSNVKLSPDQTKLRKLAFSAASHVLQCMPAGSGWLCC